MTEWILPSIKANPTIEYYSYWRNYCNGGLEDLSQWNAQLVFSTDRPTEIHFASQEDMVMFLLRWS